MNDKPHKHDGGEPSTGGEPRSWWEFLNSNLALALIGFLMTGVFGTYLSWHFTWADQDRQRVQHENDLKLEDVKAAHAQDEMRANAVRKLVDDAITQRLANTDLMMQALDRHTTKAELEEAWRAYWISYRDYLLFRYQNEIPLDRNVGAPASVLDSNPSVLWEYLDYVVDPELDKFRDCLAAAHDDVVAHPNASPTATKAIFDVCIAKAATPEELYWTVKPKGWGGPDPWKKFKICAGTFVLEVEYSLRFRQQLAELDAAPNDTGVNCPSGYGDRSVCNQLQFNKDLKSRMQEACGPLPEGAE